MSSVRPVKLIDVLPSPQGLTLFSERQQFQVFSTDTSILTPSSSVVRSISNYEMDPNISPVDVGTSAMFLSQVSSTVRCSPFNYKTLNRTLLWLTLVRQYWSGFLTLLITLLLVLKTLWSSL